MERSGLVKAALESLDAAVTSAARGDHEAVLDDVLAARLLLLTLLTSGDLD